MQVSYPHSCIFSNANRTQHLRVSLKNTFPIVLRSQMLDFDLVSPRKAADNREDSKVAGYRRGTMETCH